MISQGPVISVSSCFCYSSLCVGQPSLVKLFCFSLHPPSNWELILKLGCTQARVCLISPALSTVL